MSFIDTAYELRDLSKEFLSWRDLIKEEGLASLGEEVVNFKSLLNEVTKLGEGKSSEIAEKIFLILDSDEAEKKGLLDKIEGLIVELDELADVWQVEEDETIKEERENETDLNQWLSDRI